MIESAYITGKSEEAVKILYEGIPAILSFGPDIYALFSTVEEGAMERMAEIKGRGKRPFVKTTFPENYENFLSDPGISDNITPQTLDRIGKILLHGSSEHPIGVLTIADDNQDKIIPDRLIGRGIVKIRGESFNTVGFMVSGPDEEYAEIAENFDNGFLTGTSANYSGDPRANHSGHHRIAGVVRDFYQSKVGIFVPSRPNEGAGPSTSLVFVPDEEHAYLLRIGSIQENKLIQLLRETGFNEIGEVDGGPKHISPYDYSDFPGGKLAMWSIHKILHLVTRRENGFDLIPSSVVKAVNNLSEWSLQFQLH